MAPHYRTVLRLPKQEWGMLYFYPKVMYEVFICDFDKEDLSWILETYKWQ